MTKIGTSLLTTVAIVAVNMFANMHLSAAEVINVDLNTAPRTPVPDKVYRIDDEDTLRIFFGEKERDKKKWVYNENYVPKKRRILELTNDEFHPVVYI